MRIRMCVIPLLVLALWQSLLEEMRVSCVRGNRSNNSVSFAVAGQRRRLPLQRDFRFTARCRLLYRLLPLTYVSDLVRWLLAFLSFSFPSFFLVCRNHHPKPAAIIFDRWQSRHHRRISSDALSETFPSSWSGWRDSKDDIDYFAARKTRLARHYPWTLMTYALTSL